MPEPGKGKKEKKKRGKGFGRQNRYRAYARKYLSSCWVISSKPWIWTSLRQITSGLTRSRNRAIGPTVELLSAGDLVPEHRPFPAISGQSGGYPQRTWDQRAYMRGGGNRGRAGHQPLATHLNRRTL